MLLDQGMGGLRDGPLPDASGVPASAGAATQPLKAGETPLPLRRSLRGKGLFATLALLVYVSLSGLFLAAGRGEILDSVAALERLSRHEKALALAEAAVGAALGGGGVADSVARANPPLAAELALHMQSSARLFAALDEFDPAYALLQRAVQRSYQTLEQSPEQDNWVGLRDSMARVADELEIRRRLLAQARDAQTADYQRRYDTVTVVSLMLAVVGLALFGSLVAWFFARLAGDIRRLEAHARQIVQGTRGVTLPVHRGDELGHLMRAVNRMAVDLDEREKQIELDNQRRAHHDKMLSVGALAAGFAHEVNNPLAAIVGAAQVLRDNSGALSAQQIDDGSRLILTQADRAARAARQLAEVAAPEAAERDLIDLNALLRRVVQLTAYDRRYRHVQVQTVLDPNLLAVLTVGDALRQVLMQIMSVACDALVADGQPGATLQLATAVVGPDIVVRMSLPPVLDFTRPESQRALLICRALIEPQGGRLAFGQDGDGLLRFQLKLPAGPGAEPG